MTPAQEAEVAKYSIAYQNPAYKMGLARRAAIERALARVPVEYRTCLLDVGTGRGETLEIARAIGFFVTYGTEAVPELLTDDVEFALAWALPFGRETVETVTCFDVMEHLLPADAEPTIREFARVAQRRIVLTISNLPSSMGDGVELHVNRRPYDEWDADLRAWLAGWRVEWLKLETSGISEMWEATR